MSTNVCPNGHLWQAQPSEIPGQPSLVCAVCGLVADFASDDMSATFQSPPENADASRAVVPHEPTLHMIKEGAEVKGSGGASPATTHHSPLTTRQHDYPISTPAGQEIVPGYEILRELGRGGM